MRIKEQFYEALENPRKIKPFIWGRTIGPLQNIPYRLAYEKQYNKLHKDLFEEEKYLLIVLDACRHDYFEQEYEEYLEGELKKVYSSGRNTFQYMRNTYPRDHKDMLYVSGAPPINPDARNTEGSLYKGYEPGEHLRISDVGNKQYNEELGTCPPEPVTETTIEKLNIEHKMAAHYFQPHGPYIGKYRLGDDEDIHIKERDAWNLMFNGELTEGEMRKAYRSNLRRVLQSVKKLVEEAEDDRRIVITSDHGELFGKHGITAHSEQHPGLRLVPWLEVNQVNE